MRLCRISQQWPPFHLGVSHPIVEQGYIVWTLVKKFQDSSVLRQARFSTEAMARTRQWMLLLAATVFMLAVEGGDKVKRNKANKGKCDPGFNMCPVASKTKVCVDMSSDPSHCGKCNRGCGPNRDCVSKQCAAAVPDTPITPAPIPPVCGALSSTGCGSGGPACCPLLTCCLNPSDPTMSSCVDTSTNASNCGGCGTICPNNVACDSGGCLTAQSIATNIIVGQFDITGGAGSPTMVSRCLDTNNTKVPGYVLNITQDYFRGLGIRTYPGPPADPSMCLRASLCGMPLDNKTELTLSYTPRSTFTLDSPEGPWETCTYDNCPSSSSVVSNIIIPNTGVPAGEQLQIQSNLGNDVFNVTIILRASRDCRYNTQYPGPL